MMNKIKAGVIGASGYAGAELVRLLSTHPNVELVGINARSFIGQAISDLYPSFYQIIDLIFEDEDSVIAKSDVVFASLPHGVSEPIALKCHQANKVFIDLGADFRLYDEADYQEWYKLNYEQKELHEKAVYGLSELFKEDIANANIIGNPGCYPTSIALACAPILKSEWADVEHFIIDSKSGTTGAGKGLSETAHFPRLNESFAPYKVGGHRHTPEIEQTLSILANQKVNVTFTPHLLPVNRGIISTIYIPLKEDISLQEIHDYYTNFYQEKKFVRVLPLTRTADLKYIKYTNYCDISLHIDKRTNTLIVVSCIDNMVKGAAGQAIQNMNIRFQLNEDAGLQAIPASF